MRSRRRSRALKDGHQELSGRFAEIGSSEIREYKFGRPSYLVFCLLAVLLFGSYVLLTGFQEDNSATMAPYLTLGR